MSVTNTVEHFFALLSARKWTELASVLDEAVQRIGPFGDLLSGRDRYLDFLQTTVPADYGNDVVKIVSAPDGLSVFAKVIEHLRYPDGEFHLSEVYHFDIRDDGLITEIDIYWQTPELDPGGFGSATSADSYPTA